MKITNIHILSILAIITTILIYLTIQNYTTIVVIILGLIFLLGIIYRLIKFSFKIIHKKKRKHNTIEEFIEIQNE